MYDLGIVIPTYNEKDNIDNILNVLNNVFIDDKYKVKILVMDDSSPDGTGELIREYIDSKKSKLDLELIVRSGKQGLASAYIQGFQYLVDKFNPNFVMSIDADLSHNPTYIPYMLEMAKLQGLDLVIGSRYIEGGGVKNWGLYRKLISKMGSLYAKTILQVPINDLTGGFNLYKSKILNEINLDSIKAHGYLFQIEMKYRISKISKKILEFPIIFTDRVNGKSKMSKMIILEALVGVWKIR
jgi:dolichol-phosphate mannosyltransferase